MESLPFTLQSYVVLSCYCGLSCNCWTSPMTVLLEWMLIWSWCIASFFVTTFYCLNLPGIFVSLLKRDLDLWELYYNINFVMFTYEVSGEVSDSYHFSGVYKISSVYTYILLCIYAHIYSHTFIYIIYEWVEFL